jgi:hypothetical protein
MKNITYMGISHDTKFNFKVDPGHIPSIYLYHLGQALPKNERNPDSGSIGIRHDDSGVIVIIYKGDAGDLEGAIERCVENWYGKDW